MPNLGTFQPLFLQALFHPTLFLLSLQDLNEMNVRSFVIVPQVPGGSVQSSSSLLPVCFLYWLLLLFFQFTLSSVAPILLVSLSTELLTLAVVVFSSKISV